MQTFFQTFEEMEGILWTEECYMVFSNLKDYLTSTHILSRPIEGVVLYMYLV